MVDLPLDLEDKADFDAPFPEVVRSCEEELSRRGFPCRVNIVPGGVGLAPLRFSSYSPSFLKDIPVRELHFSNCDLPDLGLLAQLDLKGLSLTRCTFNGRGRWGFVRFSEPVWSRCKPACDGSWWL